jgi:hypothetical protein
MTKQLTDTLNLPHLEDLNIPDLEESNTNEVDEMAKLLQHSVELEEKLSDPLGMNEHIKEMDSVYDQAITAHKDMLDLAFNVEAKNSGQIFSPAAQMLQIALNASKSKNDQRLKLMKLQLERERLEQEKNNNVTDGIIQEDGAVLTTRNAIMAELRNEKKINPR